MSTETRNLAILLSLWVGLAGLMVFGLPPDEDAGCETEPCTEEASTSDSLLGADEGGLIPLCPDVSTPRPSSGDGSPDCFPLVEVTAYLATDCGQWCDGLTASGTVPQMGRTLACPPQFDFGTVVWLYHPRTGPMGPLVCEDRGGAIKGATFDIFVDERVEAEGWGRKDMMLLHVEAPAPR